MSSRQRYCLLKIRNTWLDTASLFRLVRLGESTLRMIEKVRLGESTLCMIEKVRSASAMLTGMERMRWANGSRPGQPSSVGSPGLVYSRRECYQ